MAQELARLKAEAGLGLQSVIENMTAGQLASLAIFGTVQTFTEGQRIIVRGDEPDGFYILLSGHVVVAVDDGRVISELGEGDVFGERGLLEGRGLPMTVAVTSADAEVLFMSARSFETLLQTVPAFAWEVWETAGRREFTRRHRSVIESSDARHGRREDSSPASAVE